MKNGVNWEVFEDDTRFKIIKFGKDLQHEIKWSKRETKAVLFTLRCEDSSIQTALSVDGIRALLDVNTNQVRFSNATAHFLQHATIPKQVADALSLDLNLKYEVQPTI